MIKYILSLKKTAVIYTYFYKQKQKFIIKKAPVTYDTNINTTNYNDISANKDNFRTTLIS